ncbi:ABC transporter ATP-binding protein [Yunchengibacter salinarum]|uniref:ABC transporter ATP-binding protein n=1 Tax=Yunchengibacter salinarum TaxID=3133399 RepID=UPI0035B5D325
MMAVLALEGIARRFVQGPKTLTILQDISLAVQPGELVGLLGASGAGKSTLLQIAGLLDQPSAGTISIAGEDVTAASDMRRTAVRRDKLGFVYQFHHLLPDFTALENVTLPLRIKGVSRRDALQRATAMLERIGLGERLGHVPAELSGGEQQRVAIARAIVGRPALLLADEPTGNLDEQTSERVFDLLLALVREEGVSAMVATHDPRLASRMDRRLTLTAGGLVAA